MKPEERKERDSSIQSPPDTAPRGDRVTTKERHRGESSVLADRLGEAFGGLRKRISRNVVIAGGVILLAVVLYFVWGYFAGLGRERNAALWDRWWRAADPSVARLDEAAKADAKNDEPHKGMLLDRDRLVRLQMEELKKFAAENKGTRQALVARFQIARALLVQGLRDFVSDTNLFGEKSSRAEVARRKVREAAELYQELAKEATDVPILAYEALLEGGKAWESVGDLQKAKSAYEQLVKNYPKSVFAADAQEQLKRLNDPANAADLKALKALVEQTEKDRK